MSYLLDKKIKRNKYFKYIFFVVILFILIYFRSGIFNGFSYVSHIIFRPVLILGNNIGYKLSNIGTYFYSKNSLVLENKDLKSKLSEQEARILNYNSILDENLKIKEILMRDELPPASPDCDFCLYRKKVGEKENRNKESKATLLPKYSRLHLKI